MLNTTQLKEYLLQVIKAPLMAHIPKSTFTISSGMPQSVTGKSQLIQVRCLHCDQIIKNTRSKRIHWWLEYKYPNTTNVSCEKQLQIRKLDKDKFFCRMYTLESNYVSAKNQKKQFKKLTPKQEEKMYVHLKQPITKAIETKQTRPTVTAGRSRGSCLPSVPVCSFW